MWCLTALQDNTDEFCSYQDYVFGALRQLLFLKHSPVPRDNLFHRSLPHAQISMWLQWSFNHAKVTYGYPHWDFRVRPAGTLRYYQGRSNKTHCVCAKTCLSVRAPSTKIKTGSLFRFLIHDEMSVYIRGILTQSSSRQLQTTEFFNNISGHFILVLTRSSLFCNHFYHAIHTHQPSGPHRDWWTVNLRRLQERRQRTLRQPQLGHRCRESRSYSTDDGIWSITQIGPNVFAKPRSIQSLQEKPSRSD